MVQDGIRRKKTAEYQHFDGETYITFNIVFATDNEIQIAVTNRGTLKETIANSKCEIERYDEINDNINNFVSIVVKAGRIKKLTPEIVRLLIDKIIVSEKVKTESGYKRTVTIYITHVGEIEMP